jgi:hypothetical protein
MPFFLVKDLVIMLNLDGPHESAVEKMPISNPSFVFLLDDVTEHIVLPIKFVEQVMPGATKVKLIL